MVGRDIFIGQYVPLDTPLHRLDPRLKVSAVMVGAVLIFIYGTGWEILAFTGLLFAVMVCCRLPVLKVLKSLRAVWVILLITFLMQALLSPGEVIWRWGFLSVTDTGLSNGLIFSARIALLVLLLAALTMTTAPLKLADGLESMLMPLSRAKVPVWRLTTVVSITLMFIPNILEESRKLVRSQMARGADFESSNLLRRVRNIVPVIIPLFVKVFHQADELAVAMDARGYQGGSRRSRLYPLRIRPLETFLTLLFVGLSAAVKFLP